MALNTYVCCILVLFFQVGRLSYQELGDAKALETIRRFVDVDLSKISVADAESFTSAIKTLNPARTKGDRFETPRELWEFSKKGQESCFVLVEVRPGFVHPGADDVRITMMNSNGKSQFDSTFTTSMRCYLRKIEIETKTESEFPIIVLSTENGGPNRPGPDIKKQYFGKIQNRVDLIRLENSEHVATRNNCIYDHWRCGPPAPSQSVEDWQADLNSQDRLRNLRALTWLGSVHRVAGRDQDGAEPGPDEYIKRVTELRALPSVRSRIKELTGTQGRMDPPGSYPGPSSYGPLVINDHYALPRFRSEISVRSDSVQRQHGHYAWTVSGEGSCEPRTHRGSLLRSMKRMALA